MSDLHDPFPLDDATLGRYRSDGFVHLPGFFAPGVLAAHDAGLRAAVAERSRQLPPLAERSTYGKAFQQITNLWREDATARALVFSRRLARAAAGLMGVRGVRLYHDQALFKEPGGGFTPWHVDQQYWPLASDRCVTAWIPLQATPREMGPLQFAVGSQRCTFGRDIEISDASEQVMATRLGDLPQVDQPYALGEISFHAGWTFHRAGPNRTAAMRAVMTVIYMDIDMRMKEPASRAERQDAGDWCPGIAPGQIIASPLNPILWSADP